MTRQGPGRGRGRGRFQGRGRSQNKNKNETKVKNSTEASTLLFKVGTARQASEFIKIKKHCINFFKKNYAQGHYISIALEDGKDYDFSKEKT